MLPQERIKYTLEQYLELDHNSEEKLEFWDGYVFTLAGASTNHNRIQSNLTFALRLKLSGRTCEVFPSDMRIKVPDYLPYRYADLTALCGQTEIETLGKQELLLNPQLIVEILSDSTADFDQSDKFTYYKSIGSFTEYILIARNRPKVTQYIKQSDNSWLQHEFTNIDDTFHLASIDCQLNLSEIYENVDFPERSTRFDLISQKNND
jgi:Uma2 family endonuclease